MSSEFSPKSWSRRQIVALAAGACALPVFAGTPFWEKKDPQDWTNDEIDKLTSNSPWAKEVSAPFPRPQGGYPQSGGGGGSRTSIGLPGIGGIGGGWGGLGRGSGRGGSSAVKGTVIWQSAQPILDAIKPEFPDGFAGHYIIAVSGFPWPEERDSEDGNRLQDALDQLKPVTYLRPQPGDALQPGIVSKPFSTGQSVLFGFSKDLLALSTDVREVTFTTHFGRAPIQARFAIKDMMYRGKLAV